MFRSKFHALSAINFENWLRFDKVRAELPITKWKLLKDTVYIVDFLFKFMYTKMRVTIKYSDSTSKERKDILCFNS